MNKFFLSFLFFAACVTQALSSGPEGFMFEKKIESGFGRLSTDRELDQRNKRSGSDVSSLTHDPRDITSDASSRLCQALEKLKSAKEQYTEALQKSKGAVAEIDAACKAWTLVQNAPRNPNDPLITCEGKTYTTFNFNLIEPGLRLNNAHKAANETADLLTLRGENLVEAEREVERYKLNQPNTPISIETTSLEGPSNLASETESVSSEEEKTILSLISEDLPSEANTTIEPSSIPTLPVVAAATRGESSVSYSLSKSLSIEPQKEQKDEDLIAAEKLARRKAAEKAKKSRKKEVLKAEKKAATAAIELRRQEEEEKLLHQKKEAFRSLIDFSGEKTEESGRLKMLKESKARSLTAREQAVAEMKQFCTERMGLLHPTNKNPDRELNYFEQMALLPNMWILNRLVEKWVSGISYYRDCECDMRTWYYYKDKGMNPQIMQFWAKAHEFQKEIDSNRLEKQKEFEAQYPGDPKKAAEALKQWNATWTKRLEEERNQKEKKDLEQKQQDQSKKDDLSRKQAEQDLLALWKKD